MRTSLHLLLASTLFATAAAFTMAPPTSYAADAASQSAPTKTRTPQQQRMADCSHQAKAEGKRGPERRAFMSTCLKGTKATASTKRAHKAKAATKAVAAAATAEG